MMLSYYIYNGKEKLRCGFTTGSCAAMAAKAAALIYLKKEPIEKVGITTPKGIVVEAQVINIEVGKDFSACSVIKDAGDDIDVTDKIELRAQITFVEEDKITVDGGVGVGRITRKGLGKNIGDAAINDKPREMIISEVMEIFKELDYKKGARIIISVPYGLEAAKKTFNPVLGIEGGISILGTSGIVEPKSLKALKDSIFLEMKMLRECGSDTLVLTLGNYGEMFIKSKDICLNEITVKCSNFIGESLDYASILKFKRVVLIGHIGKLCKVAGGIMDTHSHVADGRREIFACYSSLNGASLETLQKIMNSITSIECLEILREVNLSEKTMISITNAAQGYLERFVGGDFEIGIVMFDNDKKIIGCSEKAKEILKNYIEVQ